MGAEQSAQRNPKSQGDASAEELSAEVNAIQEEDSVADSKVLQKNGQIASLNSLNSKAEEQTDLTGPSEDNTLKEVGDGVSVSQKEEAPETMATTQEEVVPQVNGEKEGRASPDTGDIATCEEKAAEQIPGDANEVGFKKIFRFVGFKFTLKKDKNEKTDPVQLLTVKEKEGEEASSSEGAKDVKEEGATAEKEVKSEEKPDKTESSPAEATVSSPESATAEETVAKEASPVPADKEESAKDEGVEESPTSPISAEAGPSPFRKFFSQFNLRKMSSFKKGKEGDAKETATDEQGDKTEEAAVEEEDKTEVEMEAKTDVEVNSQGEAKVEVEVEVEAKVEEAASIPVTEAKPKTKSVVEAASPEEPTANDKAPAAEITEEAKPTVEKQEHTMEGEKAPADLTTEAELLSSQEKVKTHGSPLKKLFTGAGLKKLSTKKKSKKDAEAKLTESGEQTAELQSSTEASENPQKPESGPSSPEESGEHVVGAEAHQEAEGEGVTSDGEKKKEGILPWSSFKKMVTPKKRVKRETSESDEEAPVDKPKSATLSSTESAVFVDKPIEEEAKPCETEKPSEEDPKNENAEKLESSTEEPKRKMDTSVSWEALMCMGGGKKRARKTSDSDDDETKIEEEVQDTAEQEPAETVESPILTSQEANTDAPTVSSTEMATSPPERESTWDTLKRLVSRSKPKGEDKSEENAEQVLSDSEIPKEESSFSLKKLLPGRRKKKLGKQHSTELGSGEEDSDTPAVVPLSEYDTEHAESKEGSEIPTITVEEPDIPQINVSAEDRSPSWISATPEVEVNAEEKHEPLSDIPEEGEHAATPKSADTTIAEDDDDTTLSPIAPPKRSSRRLSTAEVIPLAPIPASGETTPVPQGPQSQAAELVLESAVPLVSEIPCQTSVAMEDVPQEEATAETEYAPPIEKVDTQTKTILEVHVKEEAMAICTGLGTKEIAKVALEKPVVSTVESVTVVDDALISELAIKGMAEKSEKAVASDILLCEAQVQQVEATELEPETVDIPSIDIPEPETASEQKEHEVVPVATMVSLYREEGVVLSSELTENSPKVEQVDPISPTVEETIYCNSVDILEPIAVEIKNEAIKEVDVEFANKGEISPVEEVVEAVTEEMTSILSAEDQATLVEATESAIPVLAPTEEYAIAKETVCLVAPLPENIDQVEVTQNEQMEKVSISKPADGEPIQVQINNITTSVANAVGDSIEDQGIAITQVVLQSAMDQVAEAKPDPGTGDYGSNTISVQAGDIAITQVVLQSAMDQVAEAKPRPGTEANGDPIKVEDISITQVVLQSAMDEVAEAKPEPEKPVTPPATNETPFPVQAVATVEKQVEMAEDKLVITKAPVIQVHVPEPAQAPKAPKVVHTAVQIVESIAVEVTECINGTPEDIRMEEAIEKMKPELKQAAEVVVSEEEVTEEEVKAAVSAESQPEETKEESKEHVPAAEVTEVKKETTPEIRACTQVVLQAALVVEEQTNEEFQIEAVVEFDSSGNVKEEVPAADSSVLEVLVETDVADIPLLQESESSKPKAVLEDSSHEVPASTPEKTVKEKASPVKCVQVMAQVMEVIEETVKEIEPVSTEITTAS